MVVMTDSTAPIPTELRLSTVAALRHQLAAVERALLDHDPAAVRAAAAHLSAEALALRAALTPQPPDHPGGAPCPTS